MRERRWESDRSMDFEEVLALSRRLTALGLSAAGPEKDMICYVEEWTVEGPAEIARLDPWSMEDVTLVHVREGWSGDFFLLAGAYHTIYRQHPALGTYCSVSHPWRMKEILATHLPAGMLWLGFRDEKHSFIRVRLHTAEVVTPGETRDDERRDLWLEERRRAFDSAIQVLDLPIRVHVEGQNVRLRAEEPGVFLFCSWPDAFGPCQFEYNTDEPYQFLVPASQLAATWGAEPASVRSYLTGFSREALAAFGKIDPPAREAYRCSVHCTLKDLPEISRIISPEGRLYATICDFQTGRLLPGSAEAWALIGVLATAKGFKIEVRLNRAPLAEERMGPWLEEVLKMPVVYSPLPPFP